MTKAIEVKDLFYSYDQKNDAVSGASFSVEKGSFVTIIGPNGSGKSTVAKLLMGLLAKKSGDVFIDGMELNPENIDAIRQKMGIVFQNPDNQFIGSTVRDDIAFGLENKCVPQPDMDGIINEFAAKVGMTELLESEPSNLSGGQKQRVAIASVLAMNLQILLFDEATSMLDPAGKRDINQLVHDIHDQQGLTVVSITHNIEEVAQSDQVILMNQGQVVLAGRPQEVFKHHDTLLKLQMDVPFTVKLAAALNKRGRKVTDTLDMERMAAAICQSISEK